jgi:hypothetical protein
MRTGKRQSSLRGLTRLHEQKGVERETNYRINENEIDI